MFVSRVPAISLLVRGEVGRPREERGERGPKEVDIEI